MQISGVYKMRTHIFSIMRNEEFLLPYFLRHYSNFADKIFIINHESTDLTEQIAEAHPMVTLLQFPYNRQFNEEDISHCFENSYKEHSRGKADWVMCVDADEFILGDLPETRGLVLKATGYMMVSDHLPTTQGQIYDELKMGTPYRAYDKPVIFDPNIDLKFGDGRHTVDIHAQRSDLKLLHYRYLSKDYYLARSLQNYPRTDMDQKTIDYRLKRGLDWYDKALAGPLEKVV